MNVDRSAWRDAYDFHVSALAALPIMDTDNFWGWYHSRAALILSKHHYGSFIQNLMLSVFEDVEQQEKDLKQISTSA